MKKSILGLGICLSLAACQEQNTQSIEGPEQYFDYPTYFNSEFNKIKSDSITQLSADADTSLTRKISLEKFINSIEFIEKLDINRAAWVGKFKVDSIRQSNGITLRYESIDEAVPYKTLEAYFEKGEEYASTVKIVKETESPLSSFKQEIKYSNKTNSLEIYNQQQKKLGKNPNNLIRLVYSW